MTSQTEYEDKGYTRAEVDILLAVREIKINQDIILNNYVKRDEFEPVQKVVYGLVGLVLVAVTSGMIALVVVQ